MGQLGPAGCALQQSGAPEEPSASLRAVLGAGEGRGGDAGREGKRG